MRIPTISFLACGLALSACSLYFEQDADGPGDVAPCTLAGPADSPPGFPFDVAYYQEVIWTLTRGYCGSGGCHAPGRDGFSGFRVWAENGDACAMIESFNDFYDHSDFTDIPENSRVLRALDGSRPGHPLLRSPGTAEYDVLYNYIAEAWGRFRFDSPAVFLDAYVFEQEIQPMLDAVGCSISYCHEASTAVAGFALYAFPEPGSPEMTQNFQNVARFVDFLEPPESTLLYQRATDGHGGAIVYAPDLLLDWIQDAYDLVDW